MRDTTISVRFHTEVIGMEVVDPIEPTPATRGQAVVLKSPGSSQLPELNWYEPGTRFGTPFSNGEDLDRLAFECDDVSTMVAELELKGVEILVRPLESGAEVGWNEALAKDPNGIWIELVPSRQKVSSAG